LFNGSFQPAEVAKFTVIIYMARWLSSKGEKLRQVTYGLLPFAIFVGGVTGLIIRQPNLSTAIIIGLCAMAMFFIAGADLIQYILLLIAGGVTVAIVIANTPYQLSRWMVFLQDPFAHLTKDNYQIAETLIALGSGGLIGRGIGSGYSKFGFVPAPHTDSIFALLGEEMGLVGTLAVLSLYLALVYRGFRIASRASDPFGQVLAAGLTFWLIFQAFVNIAVVTATIPFTGVPLPFISFGGSALVSALAAVGVLLNISRNETVPKEANATFDFGWGNGGARLSRTDRRRGDSESGIRRARSH
jgi:cell division protein FtsW